MLNKNKNKNRISPIRADEDYNYSDTKKDDTKNMKSKF
jgi:hypothetical protein